MPRYVIEYRERESTTASWQLSGNYEWLPSGRRGPRRVRDIEFSSFEEAQGQASFQQSQSDNIYRARDTQPEPEGGTYYMSAEQPVLSRTVRIYRRNRAWVVDCAGRTAPEVNQLRAYLPSGLKDLHRHYYSVEDALGGGVNPQILSSALAAWFTEHPNVQGAEPVLTEGAAEMPDNTAYLAVGDYIYKMVPVRQASSSKAVRLMRERVRVEIERVREGLRQQASQEAQQVIAQANQRAELIRQEIARERAAESSARRFPLWLDGTPVKTGTGITDSGRLFAMSKTQLVITSLSHGDKKWPMNPTGKPIEVNFWLPLNGSPDYVRLEEGAKDLPHVTSASSCLKIGETVAEVNSMERLRAFSNQVTRAFSVINLASLLSSDIDCWNPEVVALLPPAIKAWLETYRAMHIQRDNLQAIAALPPTTVLERPEETWTTR